MRHVDRQYPPEVLKRVQDIDFTMLCIFDEICRACDLTYFIDGGTCLGAVRHQGFIPWDDDVDVAMPIDDYRRFLEVAPDLLPEGISLHTPQNTEHYPFQWAKLYVDGSLFQDEAVLEAGLQQGLYIDIFPYIPLGSSRKKATWALHRTQCWQKISYLRHMSYTLVPVRASFWAAKAFACVLVHGIVRVALSDDVIRRRFNGAFPAGVSDEIWGNPTATRPFPYAKDVLFPPVEVEFRGRTVYAPHDLDGYLTELYGDYMQLPAPEHRRTHMPAVLDFGDGVNVMDADGRS